MKQFDPNKPYCRRDGKPAKIVYEGEKRYCYLTMKNGDERFYVVNKNTGYTYEAHRSDHDLINIPKKIEGWINIYKGVTVYFTSDINETKDIAKSKCNNRQDVVARKFIAFAEGEGLSND